MIACSPRPITGELRRAWPKNGTLLLLLFTLFLTTAEAQEVKIEEVKGNVLGTGTTPRMPLVREIYVPNEQLSVLLQGSPDHVFLSREEYEELLRRAAQRPATQAPLASMVCDAEYRITVQDGRAEMVGLLAIDVLETGWCVVPLRVHGVGLQRALVDGEPAALARGQNGEISLFLQGKGPRQVELTLSAPVAVQAAQQTLMVEVPSAPATRIAMTVPGNVELRSGAHVLARRYNATTDETAFDLVAQQNPWVFVLSLNNRILQRDRLVVATSSVMDQITRYREYVSATTTFSVLHGTVEQLEWRIPGSLEVFQVESDALARWEIVEDSGDTWRRLRVHLRAPASDLVKVSITGERPREDDAVWDFPRIEVQQVAGSTSVVGVLAEAPLELVNLQTSGVIPVDAILAEQLVAENSHPTRHPVRPIVAYYAPTTEFQISGLVRVPPPQVDVLSSFTLHVGRVQNQLAAVFHLQPKHERLFEVTFIVPPYWKVIEVRDADKQLLTWETMRTGDGQQQIVMRLPQPVLPGSSYTLVATVISELPGWIQDWQQQQVDFPLLHVQHAASDRGAIAVLAAGDLDVRPMLLENLSPLDQEERQQWGILPDALLAFYHEGPGWNLKLRVEGRTPRITARTYSFFEFSGGLLHAHYEVLYTVREASTRQLMVVLPRSTPAEVSIRGLQGTIVREFRAQETPTDRLWHLVLADQVTLDANGLGTAHVAVDWQTPVDDTQQQIPLPLIRAENVAIQSGYLSVEGDPQQEIRVETKARRVDPGELADAEYRPGLRLLGAYGYTSIPMEASVQIRRRELHGLPAAVVQRAELKSVVGPHGVALSEAQLELRTKLGLLGIRLPADAGPLWSIRVDDLPVTPQQSDIGMLIHLPASETPTHHVVILYEQTTRPLRWSTHVLLDPPVIFMPTTGQGAMPTEIPVANLQWNVLLPPGYCGGWVDANYAWYRPPRRWWLTETLLSFAERKSAQVAVRLTTHRAVSAPAAVVERRMVDSEFDAVGATEQLFGALEELKRGELATGASQMPQMPQMLPGGAGERPRMEQSPPVSSGPQTAEAEPERLASQSPATPPPSRGAMLSERLPGVRSLSLHIDRLFHTAPEDQRIEVISLGAQPQLSVRIWHRRSFSLLGVLVGLAVFLWGWRVTRTLRARLRFIIFVVMLTVALPAFVGPRVDFQTINDSVWVACTLVGLLCVLLLARRATARTLGGLISVPATAVGSGRTASAIPGVLLLSLASISAGHLYGQTPASGPPEADRWLWPPVALPTDAVIIPYESVREGNPTAGTRVLVPSHKFLDLWNRAHRGQAGRSAGTIADYALGPGRFEVRLTESEDYLLVHGEIPLQVFGNQQVTVAMPFRGGVVVRSTLDGQPATMHVSAEANPDVTEAPPRKLLVYVDKAGWHLWTLDIRYRVVRRGGWRVVEGTLPAPPATVLLVTVPAAATEVRIHGVPDRSTWNALGPGEVITTSLAEDGTFQLQWRPRTDAVSVAGALTVTSTAVWDIGEDGLRLTWKGVLQSRGGRRDEYTLLIPGDYLVERLTGENIRGWTSEMSGDVRRVRVELLRGGTEQEEVSLYLSQRLTRPAERRGELSAPAVNIEGASAEQGTLTVRAPHTMELQVLEQEGLTRTTLDAQAADQLVEQIGREPHLLPTRPVQAFRFASLPYNLRLAVRPWQPQLDVQLRGMLRISERQVRWESRLVIEHRGPPLHQLELNLPTTINVEQVSEPEWVISGSSEVQKLIVYFRSGRQDQLVLDLSGTSSARTENTVEVPRVQLHAATQQRSEWVVQVDPIYRVQVEELQHGEMIPLERTFAWLNPDQRNLAHGELALRFSDSQYAGRLTLSRRQPLIRFVTLTNVNFAQESIQETVLIEFRVMEAGVSQVSFALPARFADGRFRIPSLREKTITPIDLPDSGEPMIRVDVLFQDELAGVLRLIIEHDSALGDRPHRVAIPRVFTGEAEHQFVTIQQTGRDEWAVSEQQGVELLDRYDTSWRVFSDLQANQAFRVRRNAVDVTLVLQPQVRATVETVTARIGYAETTLVVDGAGGYRGRHELRIENRTEPFLEIELPVGAQLWAASVAGAPTKPFAPPERNAARIRLPLVKTQEGDKDYTVVVIYAGQLPLPKGGQKVHFPLVRTTNIHTDIHQVSLYLPETYRWFDFQGAALLSGLQEYESGYFDYVKDAATRMYQLANVKAQYKKERALEGLKQLEREVRDAVANKFRAGAADEQTLQSIQQAQRQLAEQLEPARDQERGEESNRLKIYELYQGQRGLRAKNTAILSSGNFVAQQIGGPTDSSSPATVNEHWFRQNQLIAAGKSLSSVRSSGRQPGYTAKAQLATETTVVPALNRSLQSELVAQTERQTEAAAPAIAPSDELPPVPSGAPPTGPAAADIVPSRSGLASLELEIPRQGRVYYLRGERGRVEISARCLMTERTDRAIYGIGALAIGSVLCWWLRPRRSRPSAR